LTGDFEAIPGLVADVVRRTAALQYKEKSGCPWVVFLGGTGTGKSTLFNAFCGRSISDTGVERPKTTGPILYAHESCAVSSGFPLAGVSIEEIKWKDQDHGISNGHPERLLVITHGHNNVLPLVVVDTPDLDSVEGIHREIAEDYFLLADAVVFVTSQEKYADEVPSRFLAGILEEENILFLLFNKVLDSFTKEDIMGPLETQGVSLSRDRIWFVPHVSGKAVSSVSEEKTFRDFYETLVEQVSGEGVDAFQEKQRSRRRRHLGKCAQGLLEHLKKEIESAKSWNDHLSEICSEAATTLLEEEKKRFVNESGGYIHEEVKKLFSRYDLLRKPRQFIRSLLRAPLEVLGLIRRHPPIAQKKSLSRVRGKIAFSPILKATERLNKRALEILSPKNAVSPLYRAMRQSDMVMSEQEIKALVLKEQDGLDRWLEERFQRLANDLPKGKKWGIYSTTVLWGLLILSFEVIVGGGFTVLDAALDSVIAPFVTKGVVGLFASREIQKVARELAERYEKGLMSVIAEQKKRYEGCMTSLLPKQEALDALGALVNEHGTQELMV
jgi:GTPase SAR1 family protein